jgi:hypothetical protein
MTSQSPRLVAVEYAVPISLSVDESEGGHSREIDRSHPNEEVVRVLDPPSNSSLILTPFHAFAAAAL